MIELYHRLCRLSIIIILLSSGWAGITLWKHTQSAPCCGGMRTTCGQSFLSFSLGLPIPSTDPMSSPLQPAHQAHHTRSPGHPVLPVPAVESPATLHFQSAFYADLGVARWPSLMGNATLQRVPQPHQARRTQHCQCQWQLVSQGLCSENNAPALLLNQGDTVKVGHVTCVRRTGSR